jgi:3-deoxy-D-manno-octulosonate 8-phosphate phosphatase (KDO 8-P phosphatase)
MVRAIQLLVLDVDGVLTDGRLYFGARGEALKVFHVRDGYGLVQLRRAGLEVAVISGRRSRMVKARCNELGVRHLHQGVSDKLAVLERLLARLKLAPSACACVGDDLPDLPMMRSVALSFAVADAHPAVRREVCDRLLAPRTRARGAR